MKVLVACEFSGIVRDAFIKKGHDAISCDFFKSEREGPHYQGNVFNIINNGFDLMIAHPPCKYLSSAGFHYSLKDSLRMERSKKAFKFFMDLYNSDIERIAIENPVGIVSTWFRKPDQIINPYNFGNMERKKTCLWLKNLPLLKISNTEMPTANTTYIRKTEKRKGKIYNSYFMDKYKNSHIRSRTFQGIANAFVEQWGDSK